MANLLGQNVGTNYQGILNLPTLNVGLNANLQAITDGTGVTSSLSISDTKIAINNKINIGNNAGDPGVYNNNPDGVNISVNPDTIVVTTGYSTGSYDSEATPPDNAPSAIFEMASTTQGMLLPRMTTAQRESIKAPEDGLMVYDTTLRSICYYNYNASKWYSLDATQI
jgi:hypothetical protein